MKWIALEPLENRRLLTAFTEGTGWRVTSSGDETLSSQAVDAAGNVYVSGSFKGTVDFNPSDRKTFNVTAANAAGDAFVAKYSSSGGLYWVWRLGSAGTSSPVVNDLAIDKVTSQLLVGGSFSGSYDFGQISSGDASIPGLALTSSGGTDGFWARVNTKTGLPTATGRVSGAKVTVASLDDAITKIDSDASGNLIVGGLFARSRLVSGVAHTYDDVLLTKFSASGKFIWQSRVNAFAGDLGAISLVVAPGGTVFLAGNAPLGVSLALGFDPHVISNFVIETHGAYLGSFDAATGTPTWMEGMGGNSFVHVTSPLINDLTMDREGNLLMVGTVPGGVDLSLGAGTAIASIGGDTDGFVAKYSQRGKIIWSQGIGNDQNNDQANDVVGDDGTDSIAVDAQGYIYVGGHGTIDLYFTLKAGRTNYGSGRYLAKYTANGKFLTAQITKAPMTYLAPAPTAGIFAAGIRFLGTFPNLQGDVVITRLT